MSPYRVWLISGPVLLWCIALFSSLRFITIPLLIIHQIILVLGINNLRINFFHKSLWRGDRKSNNIALTFDDGPDPNLTPEILDLLLQHKLKATFFVIAQKIEGNEEIIKRIVDEGHVIASHDYNHSVFSNFRFARNIEADLKKSIDLIEKAAGVRVRLYRPPVGLSNPNYKEVLEKLELTCISWSRKPYDAGNRRAGGIKTISKAPRKGDVILLHDALPFPKLKQLILTKMEDLFKNIELKKLSAVTIDKIFSIDAYQN